MSKKGYRLGVFMGGFLYGLVRGIFFKNKYWYIVTTGGKYVRKEKINLDRNCFIIQK